MSFGIVSGDTGGRSPSPSGDRSATSGAGPTPQLIELGIDTVTVDGQSLLSPSIAMESSAPSNLVASSAVNPILIGAHGPDGVSGEVRVDTGAVSNLSGPSLRSFTHSPVSNSNIVATDASVAVLPVVTGNQTTSDVPKDAMGVQAAGNDQSSLRLQPEPTANPTPEVRALGGGNRQSVVTDSPSSTQSTIKNSGSNRQEVGQTAANTRPPSSASTVPPTVATSSAEVLTPAKSNKGTRRSLENVVPADRLRPHGDGLIIAGPLGAVQRKARAIGRNRLSVITDEPSQQPKPALVVLVSNGSASMNIRENRYSTFCAHVIVWNVIVIRDENKIFDPGGDRQPGFRMLYAAWRCNRKGRCNGGEHRHL